MQAEGEQTVISFIRLVNCWRSERVNRDLKIKPFGIANGKQIIRQDSRDRRGESCSARGGALTTWETRLGVWCLLIQDAQHTPGSASTHGEAGAWGGEHVALCPLNLR